MISEKRRLSSRSKSLMFVALNIKNKTRVTCIAPAWDNAEETLRESTARANGSAKRHPKVFRPRL